MRILKLLCIFIDRVLYRFDSDSVCFRFFIDRNLFRVLRTWSSESSVGESSSGSAVTLFLGHQCFFPPCRYFCFLFIKSCYYFLSKTDVLFYIHCTSKTISSTCFIAKNLHEYTKYYIEKVSHQFPDL